MSELPEKEKENYRLPSGVTLQHAQNWELLKTNHYV